MEEPRSARAKERSALCKAEQRSSVDSPPPSMHESTAAAPASSFHEFPQGRLIGRKLPWARATLAAGPAALTAAALSSAASVPAMGLQQPAAPATGGRRRL
eukprot:13623633-Alexandrium_andersonii.AAC.1